MSVCNHLLKMCEMLPKDVTACEAGGDFVGLMWQTFDLFVAGVHAKHARQKQARADEKLPLSCLVSKSKKREDITCNWMRSTSCPIGEGC